MIFFTSDHHFSHQNIIRYCGRPFVSAEEMDAVMMRTWNEAVAPNDEVFYLGDFSLSAQGVRTIAPQLNGTKHLIMGNHDLCHPVHKKKAAAASAAYLEAGFVSLEISREIEIAGESVLLHHLPYLIPNAADRYGDKYNKYRPENLGNWLLCGHIHQKWKRVDRMINVGVDVWEFRPVPITTLEEIIRTGKSE